MMVTMSDDQPEAWATALKMDQICGYAGSGQEFKPDHVAQVYEYFEQGHSEIWPDQ